MTESETSVHARHPRFQGDQRRFFDELITRDWDAYQDPAWDQARCFEVAQLFARISPGRILDIGCGCGYHDRLMAGYSAVQEVIGVDYSAKSVETAERVYPHPKVKRQVGDVFSLSLAEKSMDLAVSFQVIEHVRDAQAFLEACARYVRPGGWVAVVTPNRLRLQNCLLHLCGQALALIDPQHCREYSREELIVLGEGVGLSYQHYFGYGMHLVLPKLRWSVIPQRFSCRLGYRMPAVATTHCVIFRTHA